MSSVHSLILCYHGIRPQHPSNISKVLQFFLPVSYMLSVPGLIAGQVSLHSLYEKEDKPVPEDPWTLLFPTIQESWHLPVCRKTPQRVPGPHGSIKPVWKPKAQ